METGAFTFRLPGGFFDDRGQVHDEVELIPLTGRDEEVLASGGLSPTAATSLLLCRVVKRVGTMPAVNESLVERLLVADRQFLLLKLRELTYGAQVHGSCFCTFQDCGKRVSLSFSTRDIPVKALADKRPVYEYALPANEPGPGTTSARTVLLRLPDAADQEAICQGLAAGAGAAEALRGLVRRLLVTSAGEAESAGFVEGLSPKELLGIESFLSATAPVVDLAVRVPCAECHREFTVELDLQDFFFGELVTSAEQLYKDVHYLAFHYHWAEQEILGFSKLKREHYVSLLAEELEALNAGA